MQAIQTKILPWTNTKPTRIKAFCTRGSITLSIPVEVDGHDAAHIYGAQKLCEKFAAEDVEKFGNPQAGNSWNKNFVTGSLPNGDYAHVFID